MQSGKQNVQKKRIEKCVVLRILLFSSAKKNHCVVDQKEIINICCAEKISCAEIEEYILALVSMQ